MGLSNKKKCIVAVDETMRICDSASLHLATTVTWTSVNARGSMIARAHFDALMGVCDDDEMKTFYAFKDRGKTWALDKEEFYENIK